MIKMKVVRMTFESCDRRGNGGDTMPSQVKRKSENGGSDYSICFVADGPVVICTAISTVHFAVQRKKIIERRKK